LGELESCFSLVHLSDPDDDLEHVVFVDWNVGTAGFNVAAANFVDNFHLIHQN
jgi:hypothetical protein